MAVFRKYVGEFVFYGAFSGVDADFVGADFDDLEVGLGVLTVGNEFVTG